MPTVGLNLGQPASARLGEAFTAAGYEVVEGAADVSVVTAEPDSDGVRDLVSFVVGGGRLLVCGGSGPLLAALHLTPLEVPAAPGPLEPVHAGLPPVGAAADVQPVTGVGYALYRSGEQCVALGAPRGDGRAAYLGHAEPPDDLALACLGWLCGHFGADVRSTSGETSLS